MQNDNSDKHEYLHNLRHSAAHLLAAAVLELWPDTNITIGPTIEDGFYYDFEFKKPISENDLPKIEKKMKQIVKHWTKFEKKEISAEEAKKIFSSNPYKNELIDEFAQNGQTITFYTFGKFTDLCRGGHIKNPAKELKYFKLLSLAGAYWRGDENNPMLTRIYGTAFPTQEELDEYLKRREQAKLRDHRKLGKELDLFTFAEEVGSGLPLYTDKGATIRRELERFTIDEEIKRGYKHVLTPELARVKLYEISGHYPYYKDSMYPVMKIDDDELVLRPMTCPHHFMLYKKRPRSYRELPLRLAEAAKLFRYEKSGELSGLLRVRSFCLADSHIFCRENQAKQIIKEVLELIEYMTKILGLEKGKDFWYRLSLGDRNNKKKYYDAPDKWEEGEKILKEVLDEVKAPYEIANDEAAFYGPKIDIQMKNVNGKDDTAFTVQYDFCLPARFNLEYVNEKGENEQPIVIHRSSIGAFERTMAFLIEHYAGAFPLWLAPIQISIISVGSDHREFCQKLEVELRQQGLRAEVDNLNETVGNKIRKAVGQKIPYILVIGDKEMKSDKLTVRVRGQEKLWEVPKNEFIKKIKKLINNKSLDL